jgi:hypothetical protein
MPRLRGARFAIKTRWISPEPRRTGPTSCDERACYDRKSLRLFARYPSRSDVGGRGGRGSITSWATGGSDEGRGDSAYRTRRRLTVRILASLLSPPPLGSARGKERILNQDLDLARSYAFAPDPPFVSGVLRKGSHFTIDFPKSRQVMYVSFETALSEETINRTSSAYVDTPKSSPN